MYREFAVLLVSLAKFGNSVVWMGSHSYPVMAKGFPFKGRFEFNDSPEAGEFSSAAKWRNQTPCCVDHLGELLCRRLKKQHTAMFVYKCLKNADFAFVQCCSTCFRRDRDDLYQMDYGATAAKLLHDEEKCQNRRSDQWCENFALQQLPTESIFPKSPNRNFDCSNTALAFRLCRQTCGYCRKLSNADSLNYDYLTATDPIKCQNPKNGFANETVDLQRGNHQQKRLILVFQKFAHRFSRHFSVRVIRETKTES